MIYIKTSEISNALKNSKTLEEAARLVNITTKTFKEVMEIGNINIKGDKIK